MRFIEQYPITAAISVVVLALALGSIVGLLAGLLVTGLL